MTYAPNIEGPAFTELQESFPSFTAFGRLFYGNSERIVFSEGGIGLTEVSNGVGTRQGCSWGSFVYYLAIHPLLVQLDKEFGGKVKVLAFADSVHVLGLSKLAVAEMARWEFLYGALLQGQINQKKCLCYSPRVAETLLREVGSGRGTPYLTRHPGHWGPSRSPMRSASSLRVNASQRLPMT